jgi:photosystem II stability/assembly factor-like uncharacterized protein
LPEDRDVNCLAVGEKVILAGIGNHVFLSDDEGAKWIATHPPCRGNEFVLSLLACGSRFFAGTSTGLFESFDQGSSWTAVGAGFPAGARVQALALSGSDLFAGTRYAGVYRSTDGGLLWSKVDAGLPKEADVRILLADSPDLFAVMDEGVFRLRPREAGWRTFRLGLQPGLVVQCLVKNGPFLFAGTDCGGVWKLALPK